VFRWVQITLRDANLISLFSYVNSLSISEVRYSCISLSLYVKSGVYYTLENKCELFAERGKFDYTRSDFQELTNEELEAVITIGITECGVDSVGSL
jgi:hypothetical protein